MFRHRTHYLVATRGERIDRGDAAGGTAQSGIFGHSLVSLPFSVYGGAAAEDAESERALDRCVVRSRSLRWAWGTWNCATVQSKRAAMAAPGSVRDVPQGASARSSKPICLRFRVSKGQWCARGSTHGLRSEIDITVDRFFALYADNMHRHGTPPFSKRYFARLARSLRRPLRNPDRGRSVRPSRQRRHEFLFPRRGFAVLRRRHHRRSRVSPRTTSSTGS